MQAVSFGGRKEKENAEKASFIDIAVCALELYLSPAFMFTPKAVFSSQSYNKSWKFVITVLWCENRKVQDCSTMQYKR